MDIKKYENIIFNEFKEQIENTNMMDEILKTGFVLYDEIIGGIPVGRYILISSPPGTGKTTLMVQIQQQLQKQNHRVMYFDSEQSMSKRRMSDLGLDFEKVIYVVPTTLEKLYYMISYVLKKKEQDGDKNPFVFCVDSNTSTITEQEMNSDDTVKQIQLKQRVNSQWIPRIIGPLAKTKSTLIMISQERTLLNNSNAFFGPQTEVVGGMALLYYQSQDIRLKIGSEKQTDMFNINGQVVKFKQRKNRVGFTGVEFPMVIDRDKNGFVNSLSNFIFLKDLTKSDLKLQGFDSPLLSSSGGWWVFEFPFTNYQKKFRSAETHELYETDEEFRKHFDQQVITYIRRRFGKLEKGYYFDGKTYDESNTVMSEEPKQSEEKDGAEEKDTKKEKKK